MHAHVIKYTEYTQEHLLGAGIRRGGGGIADHKTIIIKFCGGKFNSRVKKRIVGDYSSLHVSGCDHVNAPKRYVDVAMSHHWGCIINICIFMYK